MPVRPTSRRRHLLQAAASLILAGGGLANAHAPRQYSPQPQAGRSRTQGNAGPPSPQFRPGTNANQPHLSQWMSNHGNLSLPEQQRALEREPGFRELPPEAQQRMRNRLTQLNTMSPERRQHLLARTEAMERLAPEQRQQVRSAMLGLSSLPEDRRRVVAHAFRDLRALPPDGRAAAFNTDPRFRQPFSPQERATLGNLLSVEPYLPPPQQRQQPNPYSQPAPFQPLPQPYR